MFSPSSFLEHWLLLQVNPCNPLPVSELNSCWRNLCFNCLKLFCFSEWSSLFVWCCWPQAQKHFRQGLKGQGDILPLSRISFVPFPPADQNFLDFLWYFGNSSKIMCLPLTWWDAPMSKLFQFHAVFGKFGKILCLRPLEGWRPNHREILDPPLFDPNPSTYWIIIVVLSRFLDPRFA